MQVTVEDVKELFELKSLDPRNAHIIAYDTNCIQRGAIQALAHDLERRYAASNMKVYLLGYDGLVSENPIQFFEVKNAQ